MLQRRLLLDPGVRPGGREGEARLGLTRAE
jgi:hypothetical protein